MPHHVLLSALAFSGLLLVVPPSIATGEEPSVDWKPKLQAILKAPRTPAQLGITSLAFSSNGKRLVTGGWDRKVRLWDVATGKQKAALKGHTIGIDAVAISPDDRLLAWGGRKALDDRDDETTVRLWDLKAGRQKLSLGFLRAKTLAFSPDGKLLAAGGNRISRLWDVATGKVKATLRHVGGAPTSPAISTSVHALAFSPDGRLLVTGSGDQTVWLWDVATGKLKRTFVGHNDAILSVAFSPDGKRLASAGGDGIRLWEANSGKVLSIIGAYKRSVLGVTFSPNGKLLASGSSDRTVRLWDGKTGTARATLKGHTAEVNAVAFRPDGKLLASGSHDNTVRLWSIPAFRKLGR